MKKKVVISAIICAALIAGGFVVNKLSAKNSVPETVYVSPSYVIDMENLNEVVGFCSNVFVGFIEEMNGTEYGAALPRTSYDVKVIVNIKGELPVDAVVEVQKTGGLTQDSSQYILLSGDSLPESGKYYVFAVKDSDEDGVYVASGINTTVLLDGTGMDAGVAMLAMDSEEVLEAEAWKETSVYRMYEEAYRNEVPFQLENANK